MSTETISSPRRGSNGFQVELTWDASITTDSEKNIVRAASSILVRLITSKAIHTLNVKALSSGLGESSTSIFTLPSYDNFRTSYQNAIGSSKIRSLLFDSNLPLSDPFASDTPTYFYSATQTQAFQLNAGTAQANQLMINFNQANSYDLISVCLHEMTESMGRIAGFTESGTIFRSLMDISSFTAANTRAVQYDDGAYFSIDAGNNNVSLFNTNNTGDAMDWSGVTFPLDSCNAFATPNVIESLSVPDLIVLEALGYNLAPIQYDLDEDILKVNVGSSLVIPNNYSQIIGIEEWTISPNLPDGLTFSSENGSISGVVLSLQSNTLYQVMAKSTTYSWAVTGSLEMITQQNNSSLSAGAIVAIVISSVAVLAILGLLMYYSLRGDSSVKSNKKR
jgi:hypothetical protein